MARRTPSHARAFVKDLVRQDEARKAYEKSGAVGDEPFASAAGITKAQAEAIKLTLHETLGADPFAAAKEVAL